MKASLAEIAKLVDGIVIGDESIEISSITSVDETLKNSLVFADTQAHFQQAENSDAIAILVNRNQENSAKALIKVDNPYLSFVRLLQHFYPPIKSKQGIHPTAVIADDASIGKNVSIGPYVVVESGASIGDNTILKGHNYIGHKVAIGSNCIFYSNVTVYDNCKIGSKVIIHASSVIGSDGFGYTFIDGEHVKMPHISYVKIEDNVEIGANTVVDKGSLTPTIIGAGTKIDNLVQVAHSVSLGKNNILCAFTGIAGSSQTGDQVIFAANVGVSDHVKIDDNVILGARTGVPPKKHLREGQVYFGSPARPKDKALKNELYITRLPSMRKQLNHLKENVKGLTERLDNIEVKES